MKLVYRILLHLSWALSLLLAAWAVLFYFTLIDEINDEVDDALEARAEVDRKSTRLNSSHKTESRMPSSA